MDFFFVVVRFEQCQFLLVSSLYAHQTFVGFHKKDVFPFDSQPEIKCVKFLLEESGV